MSGLRRHRDHRQPLSSGWRWVECRGLSVRNVGTLHPSLLSMIGAMCVLNLVGQVAFASPEMNISVPQLFSTEWLEDYAAGNRGCGMARGSYVWRYHGFGSNMNNMLNSWVWALSVKRWEDMALLNDPSMMNRVECAKSSKGLVRTGWHCLFSPMPHLCEFPSAKDWAQYMQSRGVSKEDRMEAGNYTMKTARRSRDVIIESLEGTAKDHFGALSVMAQYVWSQLTPWIKNDIRDVTHADAAAGVNDVAFIGIHIRRGDKVKHHEAKFYRAEQYLATGAESMLRSEAGINWVRSIKGIWIASDDPDAVDEVREVYPRFFPNVESELIVWASAGVEGALETRRVVTHSDRQNYPSFVYMFADLEQLTKAELFVGTFSSNVGRLVALLREAAGKSRQSAISIDGAWLPGRA